MHAMSGLIGVSAAILSSTLGGTSVVATRILASVIDPLAIGSFRFGIGFLLLLPVVILSGENWPARRDRLGVAALGILFFTVFPVLFNASLIFTTAARGSLALSTLPLLTMLVAAAINAEPLTFRKTAGVVIAMIGVSMALLTGLASAPAGAWRGDLLMIAAALCMALYSIWSKPFIKKYGALPFTAIAMTVGAICLIALAASRGSFTPVAAFQTPHSLAALYLGLFGSALTFYLWAYALGRTTPTRVAISVTVNPISASLAAVILLHEPLTWNLAAGILAVFIGIWIATTETGNQRLRG
jgi:drug/metabolite transporter (DMT)-like permease